MVVADDDDDDGDGGNAFVVDLPAFVSFRKHQEEAATIVKQQSSITGVLL